MLNELRVTVVAARTRTVKPARAASRLGQAAGFRPACALWRRRRSLMVDENPLLPAPRSPLREVWTLSAECGVLSVSRVEPRLVGELVEHP